jgi:hypothetical protein
MVLDEKAAEWSQQPAAFEVLEYPRKFYRCIASSRACELSTAYPHGSVGRSAKLDSDQRAAIPGLFLVMSDLSPRLPTDRNFSAIAILTGTLRKIESEKARALLLWLRPA